MTMQKKCKYCNKILLRKVRSSGRKESSPHFEARKFCDKQCYGSYSSPLRKGVRVHDGGFKKGNIYGLIHGVEHRFKIGHKSNHKRPSGEKHYNWKGGITPLNEKLRKSKRYSDWRVAVFIRDGRKCVWCGSTKNIEADHIKPFSTYPEFRFDINNGRTLCHECHLMTDTYAGRLNSGNLPNNDYVI